MEIIDNAKAYELVKSPVIIASKGENNYDLTPIGWVTPYDYEPTTKVLFVSAPDHKLDSNVRKNGFFAVLVPKNPDGQFVNDLGSVSGCTVDKYQKFNIKAENGKKIDVKIPVEEISAVIECKLVKFEAEGSVDIFFGECVSAYTL